MTPKSAYIICTNPRSGSTLLTNVLSQTGVAGMPAEYFNPWLRDEIVVGQKLGVKFDHEYMEAVVRLSTSKNGIFGTKLHAFQTPFFLLKVGQHIGEPVRSLRTALDIEFPNVRYIYLKRNDKNAQAVSYYRAIMTGEWYRLPGGSPPAFDEHVEFDQLGIEKCRRLLEESDSYWDAFFDYHAISPLTLVYEEIISDYKNTIRLVLQFLGLPDTILVPAMATEKIGDVRSEEWVEKLLNSSRIYPPSDRNNPWAHWAAF